MEASRLQESSNFSDVHLEYILFVVLGSLIAKSNVSARLGKVDQNDLLLEDGSVSVAGVASFVRDEARSGRANVASEGRRDELGTLKKRFISESTADVGVEVEAES